MSSDVRRRYIKYTIVSYFLSFINAHNIEKKKLLRTSSDTTK